MCLKKTNVIWEGYGEFQIEHEWGKQDNIDGLL